nr:MAG TPA: hypothetical protein [Bacteriophage sp.]
MELHTNKISGNREEMFQLFWKYSYILAKLHNMYRHKL